MQNLGFSTKNIKNPERFNQKMRKILAIFLLIFFAGCAKNFNEISIDNGRKIIKVNVEIADDYDERMRGLMYRTKLDENSGMLFVFDEEDYQTFWMKNTLIPLDMVFIGENFNVVDIRHAIPCKQDPCALYRSSKPAKYVLEVNGDFTTNSNVEIGNKIILKSINI